MAVTTIYPDANPETSSVDGRVYREPSSETFSTIRSGAGTGADDTGKDWSSFGGGGLRITASVTTDQYQRLIRMIFGFDTSSINDTDVVSAATLSFYHDAKSNGCGDPGVSIGSATPASSTSLASSDYGNTGSTTFASKAYASISTGAYNDYTLDSNGLANITLTGTSFFCAKLKWDMDNDTTGLTWDAVNQSLVGFRMADYSGTSSDPKLVVTHAPASTFTPKAIIF